MTLLNEADAVYVGGSEAERVYLGSALVWGEPATPPASGPDISLLTSYTPGSDRNDFTGQVGIRLGISSTPIVFTWVGARCNGIGGTRTVKLYEWFADSLVLSATIDYTGKALGEYAWTEVPETTLAAGGYYALLMDVVASDGMIWTNPGPASMTGMSNIYDCYRYVGTLGTGLSGYSFVGLDLGWNTAAVPVVPVTAGLAVHHDAYQLALTDGASVTTWPNLGTATQPTIVGTPPIFKTAISPTGLPAVRFSSTAAGGMRGNNASIYGGSYPMRYTYTILYVARWVGPTGGRCFTAPYPEGGNYLIGYHTSGYDCMHDVGGWLKAPTAFGAAPGPVRLYCARSEATVGVEFFINGVDQFGVAFTSADLNYYYNVNGYQLAGGGETGDFDVCELLIYDRKLPNTERVQVEDYLRTKWGVP
jgi:hypothetical protein